MKNIVFLSFLLVAWAFVFVACAEEETPDLNAPKVQDQPENADAMNDDNESQTENDEDEPESNEDEADDTDDKENEEDETESNEDQAENNDKENKKVDENGDETADIAANDEPKKRGWACRRYRKGKLWCKACGCRRVCKSKFCSRRVCKPTRCLKKVCRLVTRYRIVKYKYRNPYYYRGYGSLYLWKTKRVPYKVRVCKRVRSFCKPRCYNYRYKCSRSCRNVCKYRKCYPRYYIG